MNRLKFMEGGHIKILRMHGDTFWADDRKELFEGARHFYEKGYRDIHKIQQFDTFGYAMFNKKDEYINCVIDLLKTNRKFRHTSKSLNRIMNE
jgi:hypothetical protein